MIGHRCLAVGNVVAGLLMLPSAMVFGVFLAPILVAGPLWIIYLGFRLWRPTERVIVLLKKTHAISLVAAGILCAYGIFALRAAERSAAEGGGLLGAFGLIPLAQGCILGLIGGASLWFAAGRKPGKKQIVLSVALTVMVFLSGAGLCQEAGTGRAGRGNFPGPDTAIGACRTIAAILSVYPALDVKMSPGTVRDGKDRTERPGCRVHASGPTSGIAGEVRPDDAVRNWLGQAGWEEDPLCAADGPGTTSFAFRKDDVLCTVGGGAHSWIEDGQILTADRYELEAGCMADPAPSGRGPGR